MKKNLSFFIIFFILSLTSCNSLKGYQEIFKNIITSSFNSQDIQLTDALKNLPYAMILIEFRKSEFIFILAEDLGNNQLKWVDASSNAFITENGKIVRSFMGLQKDIIEYNSPELSKIIKELDESEYVTKDSFIQLTGPSTSILSKISTYYITDKDFLQNKISGKIEEVNLLVEEFSVPKINWHDKNVYWIDDSGKVLKSKQTIHPNLEKIRIESLKRYKK